MSAGSATLVLQSHQLPLPEAWLSRCVESVRQWAAGAGFDYRFEDDERFFGRLPDDLRVRTIGQTVVAADLARLAALEHALAEGYEQVIWMDADVLVFRPEIFSVPADDYALGREVWVHPAADGRLRAYVKVHNAFLMFRQGNPFLAFYRHAAERIVRAHQGPMVPQLVGPKLLTALHNLVACPVAEQAGMLCPAVARDLLGGGGPALELFLSRSQEAPAALNLCGSLAESAFAEGELMAVADCLQSCPEMVIR